MIRRYALGMLAVAAMVVVAAPAEAGGGVKNTTLKTSNSSGVNVVVFSVDPNHIPNIPATVADAQKLGGVVVPNGATKSVKVLSGTGMYVVAIAIGQGGTLVYDNPYSAEAQYSLKKGASTTALVTNDGAPTPQLVLTIPKP